MASVDSSSQTNDGSATERTAALVFGGPKLIVPPMSTSLGDVDTPAQQIDSAPAEAEHLAQPQAAERAEEHERPVALIDCVGQRPDVVGVEEAHLAPLDAWERELGHRVVRDQAILERRVDALVQQLNDAVDRRRSEVAAIR